jgi:chlorite dismutase
VNEFFACDENGAPEIREKGMGPDKKPVWSNRRLFMQCLAYGECRDVQPLIEALAAAGVQGALYADINDPCGVAVAVAHEDPEFFTSSWRELLQGSAFQGLTPKPEYTMFGRTYSIGYESDLEHALVTRPLERLTSTRWPWVVWYPLRREGAFAALPQEKQREILSEHGRIGNAFGRVDLAHDIRLSCHGLDKQDNDFVVALVGKELHPLSVVVQTMRKTQQTSHYLQRLGPFFIGKAIWQRGA